MRVLTQERLCLLLAAVQRKKGERDYIPPPMFQMSSIFLGKDVKIAGHPNSCSSPCADSATGTEVCG